MPKKTITLDEDGNIHLSDFTIRPEVYAMLIKYKNLKDTTEIPMNKTINDIVNDYLIDRLVKPTGFKSLKTLDKFDTEPGK